jgi:hypothetical protein
VVVVYFYRVCMWLRSGIQVIILGMRLEGNSRVTCSSVGQEKKVLTYEGQSTKLLLSLNNVIVVLKMARLREV